MYYLALSNCHTFNYIIHACLEDQVSKIIHEINRNYYSYRFSYEFAFIVFLSFLTNHKQELGFQQVGGLVTRSLFVFCY